MPLLGAHMSIAGGLYKAVESAARCGLDCVQIFTHSPQIWPVAAADAKDRKSSRSNAGANQHETQWQGKLLTTDECTRFAAALQELKIGHPIVHDSYLINLAAPDEALWQKSIAAFAAELWRADQLNIPYVVTHPGSFTTSSEAAGLERIIAALDALHTQHPQLRSQCLLETTAGQGTNLGWRFEHLATILNGVKQPERLGICVDTCHIFAAGYPISTQRDYAATFTELDRLVGLNRVKAFHLNDSVKGLGCRVDRHAHIGRGSIGLDAFRCLLNDRRFASIPMYLETPKGQEAGEELDVVNVRALRSLLKKPPS